MRPWLVLAILLVPLLPLAPAQSAAPADLRIVELLPDPADGDREFLELWNPTGAAVDLAGWAVLDAADNTYTFPADPATTLPAGARIVVWSGGDPDEAGPAWNLASVWNNGGDQARLLAPDGTLVDTIAYGDHPAAGPAAPPKGTAIAWTDGAWIEAAPSPGHAGDGGTAPLTATVPDVPPTLALHHAPERVRTGADTNVSFHVDDGNGDLTSWRLDGPLGTLATGHAVGDQTVTVQAPPMAVDWRLALHATDAAGNTTSLAFVVRVLDDPLQVTLPPDGLAFPSLVPGATNATLAGTVQIENLGDAPVTPLLDVSDLTGPATVPLVGVLQWRVDDGPWTDYAGPLAPLPDLAPGASYEVALRLQTVPSPLPAGVYGTSFTVTA